MPPTTLDDIATHAWAQLVRGVKDRKHGFHLPTLCTIDDEGRPSARTVVLRKVLPDERVIICHTDVRSPKASDVRERAHTGWMFYDTGIKEQVRAQGRAEVLHEGDIADAHWAASRASSRRCYLAPHTPSAGVEEESPNLPAEFIKQNPTEEQTEAGRANFAVIRCVVDRLEWLHIKHDGHRRAGFSWDGAGVRTETWLTP